MKIKISIFFLFVILFIGFLLNNNNLNQKVSISESSNKSKLKDFNIISGPFTFRDKANAAKIIGKVICLDKYSKGLNNEEKERLIISELLKKDLSPEIRNSFEVIKASKKVSEILNIECENEISEDQKLESIFKQYFKYNKN